MENDMPKASITVIKIPMSKDAKIDKPAIFPPMSDMFLEYFENKNKLRSDYVNKGYKKNTNEKVTKTKKNVHEPVREPVLNIQSHQPPPTLASSNPDTGRFLGTPEINDELTKMIQHTEHGYSVSNDEEDEEDDDDAMVDIKMLRNKLNQMSYENSVDGDDDFMDSDDDDPEPDPEPDMSDASMDSIESVESIASEASVNKYATPRNKRGYVDSESDMRKPIDPTPYNSLREEEEKREMLFKFEMLKKSYPGANIRQDFTVKSDLNTIKTAYEMSVRRLSMDTTVEKYKSYLMAGFMATEYAFGHFLGLDMQGYTQQQILQMTQYEKLLIELGEKSYVPDGVSKFPVEVRLLFLVLMNAAIFVGSKMLMAKTGANLLNMVNSMNSFSNGPQQMPQQMPMGGNPGGMGMGMGMGKRKMRGPTINVNEI
tara:strand:+ start:3030 stop:4310 length:1281 start_codon:yes stop_codon:yes gene_type:complete